MSIEKLRAEIAHFNTRTITTRDGQQYTVCACAEWAISPGEGLQGECVHTNALGVLV